MLVNIYMKFHEDILNGFQVTERTRFCDRQTDNPGKNNMSPNPKGGRHKNFKVLPVASMAVFVDSASLSRATVFSCIIKTRSSLVTSILR